MNDKQGDTIVLSNKDFKFFLVDIVVFSISFKDITTRHQQ